jgi:uncharacterized protein (DUF1697 family)
LCHVTLKEIALIVTQDEKEIMAEMEAQLLEAGCPNVGRLLVQRGVALLRAHCGLDWKDEKAKIMDFVDGVRIVT